MGETQTLVDPSELLRTSIMKKRQILKKSPTAREKRIIEATLPADTSLVIASYNPETGEIAFPLDSMVKWIRKDIEFVTSEGSDADLYIRRAVHFFVNRFEDQFKSLAPPIEESTQ